MEEEEVDEGQPYVKLTMVNENGSDDTVVIWCGTHQMPRSSCGCG